MAKDCYTREQIEDSCRRSLGYKWFDDTNVIKDTMLIIVGD